MRYNMIKSHESLTKLCVQWWYKHYILIYHKITGYVNVYIWCNNKILMILIPANFTSSSISLSI